ncbi:phosphotransferase enzyme family protein [Actinopolymorpha alba]|uniref:phosphotransferase enzyme family protein n=1 Tax=Actinopolymorpha alba TaxID=533267 RepID=UPI00037700FA|nr:aminoglycoside phosphotransferase family protein [Actinopolymorpha alba]
MLTPPEDLAPDQVSSYLHTYWGLDGVQVSYLPAGHGSHNWTAVASDGTTWFVKAMRRGPDSDFSQATLQTATAAHQAGLDFVLAPIPDHTGAALRPVSPAWQLALFPHVEGRNPDFGSSERVLVGEILGRLHSLFPLPDCALRWEPGWFQPELKQVLAADLDRPWTDGPYGERARALLTTSVSGIERLLAHSDRLVARLGESDDPYVLTHGEPHEGNTMLDTSGRMHLIDCDAMMVAPRERDLRLLLYASHRRPRALDNTDVVAAYQRTAGPIEARPFVLELFRAEWHLIEMARYAWLFGGPHGETAEVRVRWEALTQYLPVTQNWPELGRGRLTS